MAGFTVTTFNDTLSSAAGGGESEKMIVPDAAALPRRCAESRLSNIWMSRIDRSPA
jgi:hypothetical protein